MDPVANILLKIHRLSQSATSIPLGSPSDLIYTHFNEIPVLSKAETAEGMWLPVNRKMDAVFAIDSVDRNIRRGPMGIDLVIAYLNMARKHSTWNGDADRLLKIKLDRLCAALEDTVPSNHKATPVSQLKRKRMANQASGSTPVPSTPAQAAIEQASVQAKVSIQVTPNPIRLTFATSPTPASTQGEDSNEATPGLMQATPSNQVTPHSSKKPCTRNVHDLDFKMQVIQWHKEHRTTQTETSRHFSIQQTSLSRWLAQEEFFNKQVLYNGGSSKRQRKAAHPELEQALFHWVMEAETRDHIVTDAILRDRAIKFGSLLNLTSACSSGWLYNFKRRHRIFQFQAPSNSGSTPAQVREQLLALTADYELCDIYTAQKTGLTYKMPPNRTLGSQDTSGVKGCKKRITYHFACNVEGTHKLPPLVVGFARKPRAFGRKSASELGFDYHYNKTAWMTSIVFISWVSKLDATFRDQNRSVLLLLDSFSVHPSAIAFLALTNIKIYTFPRGIDHALQPFEVGIIRAFKAYYRADHLKRIVSRYDENPSWTAKEVYEFDQLEAMKMAQRSWDLVTAETIRNCCRHTMTISKLQPEFTGLDPDLGTELVDDDLWLAIKEAERQLEQLGGCERLDESKPYLRMNIEELLNPMIELTSVKSAGPIPTEEEILELIQGNSQDAEDDDEEPEEPPKEKKLPARIPWTVNKARKALEEVVFLLKTRTEGSRIGPANNEEPDWAPHLSALASLQTHLESIQHTG